MVGTVTDGHARFENGFHFYYREVSTMRKKFVPLRDVVMLVATAAIFSPTPSVLAGQLPNEYITATTYIDSRNNTSNYSASKIKLVANALGIGSNDGSITRGLFSLPTDLDSIPAAEVASAKIYFYNYGISPPNYTQPNPPAYAVPDVVLHPLTQGFYVQHGHMELCGQRHRLVHALGHAL